MRKPYYVCGGLQDNGSWCGPSATRASERHPQLRLVPRRRRRRFLHAERPDRLDHPLLRVAGRHTQPPRPAQTAARRASARAAPRAARAGGAVAGSSAAADGGAVRLRRRVPRQHRADAARRRDVPVLLEHADSSCRRTIRARCTSAATGCSGRTNRGDTWTMSPDLTRNVEPVTRPIMGVAGNAPMASKHDGAASYSNIVTVGESPVVPGIVWVGTNDGNLQVSRDGGTTWKNVVDERAGRAEGDARVAGRAVALRRRHVLRHVRRPPHRRSQALRLRDDAISARRGRPSPSNLPAGNVNVDSRGSEEQEPAVLSAPSTRFYVSLNGGQGMEARS